MKYRYVNVVGFHVKYMYYHSIHGKFYLSVPVILYSNKNSVPYVTQNNYIVRE